MKWDTRPAWMTKGLGIGEQILGQSKGDLVKPGMTQADLDAAERRVAEGPDPFGEIFREHVKVAQQPQAVAAETPKKRRRKSSRAVEAAPRAQPELSSAASERQRSPGAGARAKAALTAAEEAEEVARAAPKRRKRQGKEAAKAKAEATGQLTPRKRPAAASDADEKPADTEDSVVDRQLRRRARKILRDSGGSLPWDELCDLVAKWCAGAGTIPQQDLFRAKVLASVPQSWVSKEDSLVRLPQRKRRCHLPACRRKPKRARRAVTPKL